jgi:predicted DNA-binding ribbon-helix-helix protein
MAIVERKIKVRSASNKIDGELTTFLMEIEQRKKVLQLARKKGVTFSAMLRELISQSLEK